MKKYFVILVLLMLGFCFKSQAQGSIELSQKWLCRSFFNPAATGNVPYLELYAVGRQQWVGVNGAPFSAVLHAHSFLQDFNSGVGLSISNDMIGFYSVLNAKASYAFHLFPDRFSAFSFGLSAGILSSWRDNSRIDLLDTADPDFNPDFQSEVRPDFDFGVEYRNRWLRAGASVMHILGHASTLNGVYVGQSFYAYAGARFDLNDQLSIMPSAFSLYNAEWHQLEAGATLYYKKRRDMPAFIRLREESKNTYDLLWVGLYVRRHGDIALLAGVSLNENIRVGYSYDYTFFGDSRAFNTNSHEILLSYRISTARKVPRTYYCEDC